MRVCRAHLLVLALMAALVASTAAPVPAEAREVAGPHTAASAWDVPVRVGTYNIRAGTSYDDFTAGADEFKQRVDVAGLQEIGRNDKNRYLLADWTWGYYRPEELQQNPVIWDTSVFRMIDARGALLAKGREVGDEKPSGNEVRKDSYATVVRLQHLLTGELVSIINVHLVSGAVRGGLPWPDRPLLFAMYKEQVASLAEVEETESSWGRVFVVGDFNAGYKADRKQHLKRLPYATLTRLGRVSMWRDYDVEHGGTHRDAYIDQVWSAEPVDDAEVAYDIKHSDHYPAIATYSLSVLPE